MNTQRVIDALIRIIGENVKRMGIVEGNHIRIPADAIPTLVHLSKEQAFRELGISRTREMGKTLVSLIEDLIKTQQDA